MTPYMTKLQKNKSVTLSIIILNYNTQELLRNCLQSIKWISDSVKKEMIVVDNGSIDQSIDMLRKEFPEVILVENKENVGFAKGNNAARAVTQGEYVLFLNSDTEVKNGCLDDTVRYLEEHPEVGAITCKTVLPTGELDRDARRSFPTPWVALTHFSYLDRLFPTSPLFSKYWYGYKSPDELHEVDVLQGAFMLTRKQILDTVGWYDESYFLDGEDIDLCWKIKKAGYKIIYYPSVSILHVKKATKKKNRTKAVATGIKSMELFYKKRMWNEYPLILNYLVILGIRILTVIRTGKRIILG